MAAVSAVVCAVLCLCNPDIGEREFVFNACGILYVGCRRLVLEPHCKRSLCAINLTAIAPKSPPQNWEATRDKYKELSTSGIGTTMVSPVNRDIAKERLLGPQHWLSHFLTTLHVSKGDTERATANDFYSALAHTVRDRLIERWISTVKNYQAQDVRVVRYLCAELLTGPYLANNLVNVGIYDETDQAMRRSEGVDRP